ncbi:MAG TPA: endo-1,4-beta-xylanase [Rhizomicrobium sp.]|nr:endo-1,4-beta-xylanase [Rhizomicrobium sp.]
MTKLSRRTLIAAAAGMSLDPALGTGIRRETKHGRGHTHHHKHEQAAGADPDSLNGAARAKGLMFGSALGASLKPPAGTEVPKPLRDVRIDSFGDPRMRALFTAQCGILVPVNELKWDAIRREPGKFDFTAADRLVDFAGKHGLSVRGQPLLWNRTRWMPPWVLTHDFGAQPAAAAEKMLREHIRTVTSRYSGRIFSYDVIDETIASDTGELEDSPFTKILGPDVIDICFHAAREYAPGTQLVYNDYMSWERSSAAHRAGVLRLIERMKQNNVPIDALGIQAHIGSNALGAAVGPLGDVDETEWRKFLDAVTGMGLDLVITEFDVNDRDIMGDAAARDQVIAGHARAFLDIALGYPQLRYVVAWGLVDKFSWLQRMPPRYDGQSRRPAPYDDNFEPKALRATIVQAFAAAPERPAMEVKPA